MSLCQEICEQRCDVFFFSHSVMLSFFLQKATLVANLVSAETVRTVRTDLELIGIRKQESVADGLLAKNSLPLCGIKKLQLLAQNQVLMGHNAWYGRYEGYLATKLVHKKYKIKTNFFRRRQWAA